jgi:bifunctional DNA-binding transcriptional regulator/antitoxin component of YhaV-PrlF toxin-antitoxin module
LSHSKPKIIVAKDGRITLPKEILDKHGWPAGTKFLVEDGEGRAAKTSPRASIAINRTAAPPKLKRQSRG